jgi:hypothetical protein
MSQIMSDEQLARMLQDELFQEELRNNPEFSHLAGRRNPRSSGYGSGFQGTGRSTYSGAGGVRGDEEEGPDLLDRLAELGDNAKRRFQAFAASWNDPNAQSASRPGGGLFGSGFGGTGSQTNVNRGNERRGLLSNDLNMDEEEEEEMDFVGGGSSGRDFEMNENIGGGDKKKD